MAALWEEREKDDGRGVNGRFNCGLAYKKRGCAILTHPLVTMFSVYYSTFKADFGWKREGN